MLTQQQHTKQLLTSMSAEIRDEVPVRTT